MPTWIDEGDYNDFNNWKKRRQKAMQPAPAPDPAWRAATQPASVYEEFPGATAPQPIAPPVSPAWAAAVRPEAMDSQRQRFSRENILPPAQLPAPDPELLQRFNREATLSPFQQAARIPEGQRLSDQFLENARNKPLIPDNSLEWDAVTREVTRPAFEAAAQAGPGIANIGPSVVRGIVKQGPQAYHEQLKRGWEERPEPFPGAKGLLEFGAEAAMPAPKIRAGIAAVGKLAGEVAKAPSIQQAARAVDDAVRNSEAQRVARQLTPGGTIQDAVEQAPKVAANALSGKPLGSPPEVGGAVLGGVAGGTQGETPEERARNAIIGLTTGGLTAHAMRKGIKPGATIENISDSANAANRKLANMYENPKQVATTPGLAPHWFEAGRRAVVRGWTDRDVDLGQWQKAAEKAKGRPLTPDELAYELKRLNPDKAAETHLQEGLRPALLAVGKDQTALSVYLTHQDNIDVARVMNNPNRKFSGGLTAADSQQALQDMEAELGPERMATIKDAAEQLWTLNRALLQRKVDSGLITQELFDVLTDPVKGYPHYSPTRITDYLTEPSNIGRGKSLSVRDTGLKRNTVEGTVREREDPLASTVRNVYQTEALARKNEAFQAFIKQSQYDPEMAKLVRPVEDSYKATRDEVKITGFIDGKRQTYVVPKPIESLVKGEPGAVIPGFSGAVWGSMMGLFRAVTTAASPVFLAKNATLDIVSYALRESSRAGGPQNLPKVLYELVPAYADAFRGILQQTYHGSAADFLKGGGGMFGFFQGSPGQARATVESLGRNSVFTVNNAGDLARLAKSLATLGPVRGVGERIELAPRIASARLAKKRGVDEVRAVINGRTVTMDFQMGGSVAKVINQFVPFFNVGMQAPAQMYRAYRERPKAFLATMTTLLAGPVVAAEAWNRADAQRAKDYDDVPQYVKDQGVVVMLPGQVTTDARGNRRPAYVQLRFREFAPIAIVTREAVNRALGDDPREWQDLLGNGLLSISPVQGNNSADMISSFTPLGVSTGLQLATNKDYFRDRMIATKGQDEQASALSKAVGGVAGIRPSQVEFAARDLGGGAGGAIMATSDIIAGKQPETPQEQPVIGGFTGAFSRSAIGGRLDKAKQQVLTDEAKSFLKTSGVDINVAPASYTINNIPLTMAEQEQYQVLTNQYVDEGIKKLQAWPRWQQLGPEDRLERAQTVVRNARDQAASEVRRKMGTEEYRKRRDNARNAASQ